MKHIVVYVDGRGFCVAKARSDFYEIVADARDRENATAITSALNEVPA